MKYLDKEAFDRANMFGASIPNDAFAQYFTGESFLSPMVIPQEDLPLLISNVTFAPGCRNCWHVHTSDGPAASRS